MNTPLTLFNPDLYKAEPRRRCVHDLPTMEKPLDRLKVHGAPVLSLAELMAAIFQTKDALDLAYEMLEGRTITDISRMTTYELCQFRGIGEASALRLKAAFEIGRRLMATSLSELPRVTSPGDAANLLMPEMQELEQEQFIVLILNTRNQVIKRVVVYQGSLNTQVIRVAEVFRPAIKENGAAIIIAHNHPSGDPSPSPEDIAVTRTICRIGKEMDIDVLDHIVIGRQRYISLKERGLGFDV